MSNETQPEIHPLAKASGILSHDNKLIKEWRDAGLADSHGAGQEALDFHKMLMEEKLAIEAEIEARE